jgi:serine/threonine protein kinase
MTVHANCPAPGLLKELLHGTLAQEQQDQLHAHLETCEHCQRVLESLAAGRDSWSGAARHLGQAPPAPDPALRDVVQRLGGRAPGQQTQAEPGAADVSLSFLSPPDKPGSLGRLGHHDVLEVIGRGGFGVVLRAHDPALDRTVAIKVLAPHLAQSSTARKRFLREAKAAAAVVHEHVVTIHAIEEANGLPYLVMQYIAGISLQQRIDNSGPLEVKEILRIGNQAARGLAAAHAQGLIHRDVKPANILLENGVERVKLTDFGLARAIDDASLTQSGVVAGTPQYMAPEQANGEVVDHRADLFSLGSVLYATCTGRPPFRASTLMGVLKRVTEDSPRPIREINPDVPEWLEAIVEKLHAKEPVGRFQSAAEVAELLGQHLAHLQQPSIVRKPPTIRRLRVPPPARKSHAVFWVVLAVSVLGFACCLVPFGVLALYWGADSSSSPPMAAPVLTPRVVEQPGEDHGGAPPPAKLERAGPAPFPPANPFRRIGRPGQPVQWSNDLAALIDSAQPGDTIEVHGTGPFVLSPITIKGKAVTLRAAAGFQPILTTTGGGRRAPIPLLSTNAPLVLEGLHFQITTGPFAGGEVPYAIRSVGAPFYAANCRFEVKGDCPALGLDGSPTCELRNCLFLGSKMFSRVDWACPVGGRLTIENCIIAGGDFAVAFHFNRRDLDHVTLRVSHSTLAARVPLVCFLDEVPAAAPQGMDPGWPARPLRIVCTESILDGQHAVLQFDQSSLFVLANGGKVLSPQQSQELLERLVRWSEQDNLYAVAPGVDLLDVTARNKPVRPSGKFADLAQWDRFWKLDGPRSLVGLARYQGGDPHSKTADRLAQVTAADFRLDAKSPGKGKGKQSKDLGADVDLIGPGKAYEQWKNTADYQRWLEAIKKAQRGVR